jgi:hypothetical protein
MATAHSTWTRDERIRQVLEGRRHLGQQVMEAVFISSEQIPEADVESRFGELVRDVVLIKPGPERSVKERSMIRSCSNSAKALESFWGAR